MKLFDVYPLFDVEIVKGKNCLIYDNNGNEYLDFYGGHAVISIGHSHPHYLKKLTQQAECLGFYSNSVQNSLQNEVAVKLGKISGYDDYSLFLVNSGAEANENALKLASFHTARRKVVAFTRSFHGRTAAAVRVTDNKKIVAPLNEGFDVEFLPFNNIENVHRALKNCDVAAVIIEGIQGVGGVQIPENDFLIALQKECNDTKTVLILDEIQCGYGRSGKFFAHQYANIRPDIITVAKGMGNGFPVGAVLISPDFQPAYGMLGTTFGGNHLACAASSAVLDVIESENLVENAKNVGNYLLNQLKSLPTIKEVRGRGLMIGIEFDFPIKDIRNRLLFDKHIFTGASGSNTIRLLPPLCLSQTEADKFLNAFSEIIITLT